MKLKYGPYSTYRTCMYDAFHCTSAPTQPPTKDSSNVIIILLPQNIET